LNDEEEDEIPKELLNQNPLIQNEGREESPHKKHKKDKKHKKKNKKHRRNEEDIDEKYE
jgi:hypothetical protein